MRGKRLAAARRWVTVGALWLIVALPVAADEGAILRDLGAAFAEPAAIPTLAARIAADPSWEPRRLGEWLHAAAPYPILAPGRFVLGVDVGLGRSRVVTLRIPAAYRSDRPWPVVYVLHPSGGNGPAMLGLVESWLGPAVDDFVLAAPTDYRQTGIDAPPPFTNDHRAILRAVRERVHVDADRVYVLGYSLGGYASWSVALLHAEEIAAAVPLASTVTVPPDDRDGLWREVIDNLRNLGEILFVWGRDDTLQVWGFDGSLLGGIGELNRRYRSWSADLDLPQTLIEQAGRGHGNVVPPRDRVLAALSHRRTHWPRQVTHTYRHLHQGAAYWLEAVSWQGDRWGEQTPPVAALPGERKGEAFRRVLAPLLGHLAGTIEGQTLRITTRHVGTLDVWLGEGMVDWGQPLRVERDGQAVFEGRQQPDLALALAEAVARRDFERLRWARVRSHRLALGGGSKAAD